VNDYSSSTYRCFFFTGDTNDALKRNPGLWFHPNQPSVHFRMTTKNNGVVTSEVWDTTPNEAKKWVHVKYN
jgi:hypothetical protein